MAVAGVCPVAVADAAGASDFTSALLLAFLFSGIIDLGTAFEPLGICLAQSIDPTGSAISASHDDALPTAVLRTLAHTPDHASTPLSPCVIEPCTEAWCLASYSTTMF